MSWRSRSIPKEGGEQSQTAILALFLLSLIFFFLTKLLPFKEADAVKADMLAASRIMSQALEALRECRLERNLEIDEENDPNRSGLIGRQFSPLTTSRGLLGAKRSTTNPNLAALLVFLLREAEVSRGDTIAVGASGSFPASIVAVFSAAKTMELRPLAILSLGASQWGANEEEFHWLNMQDCLEKAGLFEEMAIGLSLGGDEDVGEGMSPEVRSHLETEIARRGTPFLRESRLRRNVEARMSLYAKGAGTEEIQAFVHVGGAWANMGESAQILHLEPGLTKMGELPPPEQRGVLHEMGDRGIPVIHLLYVKGLLERYGLPWDPIPLPEPGQGDIYRLPREKDPRFLILAVTYLLLVSLTMFRSRRSGS
jgi:poly-gamma-glutamate system protein